MLKTDCIKELTGHIIPFWDKLRDDENGGFTGQVGYDLTVDKKGDKGVILNSRILWFYSSVYLTFRDSDAQLAEKALDNAAHAYEFLRDKCVDRDFGGVYWMMKYDGEPCDTMKHTYNQAFAIYALSTYFEASGCEEALDLAFELFDTVEEKCTDDVAYMEAFDREWQLIENDALSENGLMADKTMNTVLHLIEAYTVLYKVSGDEEVAERLRFLLDITENKIYDHDAHKLLVFFDRELSVIGDIHSYGHDIEAQWLIDRACDVLGDEELKERWKKYDLEISENIYDIAYDKQSGSLFNERDNDYINRKRIWWVQAETVVGFVNAYQHGGDKKFLEAAEKVMEWIKSKQVDKRCGEWYSQLDENGEPAQLAVVDEWKCPYHNGRMCMEIIARL